MNPHCIEIKSWIRIRIETLSDPQHCREEWENSVMNFLGSKIFCLFTGRKWGRKWNLGNLGRVYEELGEWWRLWWRQWGRRRLHEQPRQQASQRADGRHQGQGGRDTGIAICRVADTHSIQQKYEVIFDFCFITVVRSYFVRYGYPVTIPFSFSQDKKNVNRVQGGKVSRLFT